MTSPSFMPSGSKDWRAWAGYRLVAPLNAPRHPCRRHPHGLQKANGGGRNRSRLSSWEPCPSAPSNAEQPWRQPTASLLFGQSISTVSPNLLASTRSI
jgi:hypothetical protein